MFQNGKSRLVDHIRSNLDRTLGTMTLSGRSSSSSPSRRVSSPGGMVSPSVCVVVVPVPHCCTEFLPQ